MSARLVRKPWGQSHFYELDGHKVPGVTTVLGKTIDKPGLRTWYARQGVRWAMQEGMEALGAMDERELMSKAGKAPDLVRDRAAAEGKTLHAYAEALGAGQEIAPDSELAARAEAIATWLDQWRVKVLASELVVWHEHLGYAGTLDVVADLWMGDRWQRWLLDYKTGASIYPEVVLQLAAYRFATHCVMDGEDRPMGQVQATGVVHVTSSGVALKPVHADAKAMGAFEHGLALYRFLNHKPDELVDPELPVPALPVGEYQ